MGSSKNTFFYTVEEFVSHGKCGGVREVVESGSGSDGTRYTGTETVDSRVGK